MRSGYGGRPGTALDAARHNYQSRLDGHPPGGCRRQGGRTCRITLQRRRALRTGKDTNMNRLAIAVTVASGALGAALQARPRSADSLAPGDERFKFVAGWFLPAFNTDVRIDDTDNRGRRRGPRRRPGHGPGPVGRAGGIRMADGGAPSARRELEFVLADRHAHHRRADHDRRRGLPGQRRDPHQVVDRPDPDHVLVFVPQERQATSWPGPSASTGTRFRCR